MNESAMPSLPVSGSGPVRSSQLFSRTIKLGTLGLLAVPGTVAESRLSVGMGGISAGAGAVVGCGSRET